MEEIKMKTINKEQLEDLMVTVWEGGSDYWMDVREKQMDKIRNYKEFPLHFSFAEKMASYLMDGNPIRVSDCETGEYLETLTLEKINQALNSTEISDLVNDFLNEEYDADTTDVIIQYALFNEVVYG
jgi:hypothetical protein